VFIFFVRHSHCSKTIRSRSGFRFMSAILGVSGRRDTKEVEVEGTKTRAQRNEKGSPTHPQPQASSHPLLNKEGSAICHWFLELFSQRSFVMSGLNTRILLTIELGKCFIRKHFFDWILKVYSFQIKV
jgi:hypothetical protein